MTTFDAIMLGIIIVSAVVGAFRGFLREAIGLATWIVALLLAWHMSDLVEPYLGGILADSPARPWAARVVVFFLVLLAGAGVAALVSMFVRASFFSGADRMLGVLFGVLRGIVLLGVIAIIGQTLRLDGERWWTQSQFAPYAESVGNVLRAVVGDSLDRRAAGTEPVNT
ncbi:MAG: CvpA family protein [Steroidobacteraceae bacterium]